MVQKVDVRQRVRGWALPCHDLKSIFVNPAVNGYFFELGEEKAIFHLLCPRYRRTLTLTASTSIRLWKTFTLKTVFDSLT